MFYSHISRTILPLSHGFFAKVLNTVSWRNAVLIFFCYNSRFPKSKCLRQYKCVILQLWRTEIWNRSHRAKNQSLIRAELLLDSTLGRNLLSCFLRFLSAEIPWLLVSFLHFLNKHWQVEYCSHGLTLTDFIISFSDSHFLLPSFNIKYPCTYIGTSRVIQNIFSIKVSLLVNLILLPTLNLLYQVRQKVHIIYIIHTCWYISPYWFRWFQRLGSGYLLE